MFRYPLRRRLMKCHCHQHLHDRHRRHLREQAQYLNHYPQNFLVALFLMRPILPLH